MGHIKGHLNKNGLLHKKYASSYGLPLLGKKNPENEFFPGQGILWLEIQKKALKAGKSQETKRLWQSTENILILFKEYGRLP